MGKGYPTAAHFPAMLTRIMPLLEQRNPSLQQVKVNPVVAYEKSFLSYFLLAGILASDTIKSDKDHLNLVNSLVEALLIV